MELIRYVQSSANRDENGVRQSSSAGPMQARSTETAVVMTLMLLYAVRTSLIDQTIPSWIPMTVVAASIAWSVLLVSLRPTIKAVIPWELHRWVTWHQWQHITFIAAAGAVTLPVAFGLVRFS